MAALKNTPNADQAAQFDASMKHWQAALSLGDWRIERDARPAKAAMASVEFNDPARMAIYRIGDWGGDEITQDSLHKTALHECLHILLHDLLEAAEDRGTPPDEMEAAEHRVINVLERVLTKG